MNWRNWFSTKEECDELDELKAAVKENKAALQETIKLEHRARQGAKSLLKLSEDALKSLDDTQESIKRNV